MSKDAKHEQEGSGERPAKKLSRKAFEKELVRLQGELCHLQAHVVKEGLKAIVVFEGRDAAGKGGVIKRITERTNPRVFRVVALPAPSDRQKSEWYPKRYIEHFPGAGEIMLFDRSWYNRAGVERVMGFCSDVEYEDFLRTVPAFEREVVRSGTKIIKYFFDVSQEVQEQRFLARAHDPMRHWKLSPMDVESWRRWWDYTEAYSRMLAETDIPEAPWFRVPADEKRRARLNCISHLLAQFDYEPADWKMPEVGKRHRRKKDTPKELIFQRTVPQVF